MPDDFTNPELRAADCTRPYRRWVLAVVGLFLPAACGSRPPTGPAVGEVVLHDFVSEARFAVAESEPLRIDLGTPGARRHLVRGWSKLEDSGPEATPFVWSSGQASLLEFFVSTPRDLRLELHCFPFNDSSAPAISVRANGKLVGTVRLEPGPRTYRLSLPARLLSAGINRLEFQYEFTEVPARTAAGSNDQRELAVGWSWVGFSPADREAGRLDLGAAEATTPSADQESHSLRIPARTTFDFYARLDTPARLAIDEVRLQGHSSCRLRISMEPDAGPVRVLAELREAPFTSLPISAPAGELARLSFAAVCGSGQGGVAIVRGPTLRGPQRVATRPPIRPRTGANDGRRPPVIVYLVDALRADRLGCYGYSRPVSPHVDAFARQGLLFAEARSHTSWTRPAVASLFTGLDPRAHGVVGEHDGLSQRTATLAGKLRAAGYRTGAVIANGNVGRAFGFANGFDFFRETRQAAGGLNRPAVRWLDEGSHEQPSFLYLHAIEPHDPYDPPAAFRRLLAPGARSWATGSERRLDEFFASGRLAANVRRDLERLYDAEVAASDAAFGELVELLRARGLYDRALIVFLADHGEALGDHGSWRHGQALYQELVHIPLIVKRPHAAPSSGRRLPGLFQPADVYQMILAELAVESEVAGSGPGMLDAAEDRSAALQRRTAYYSLELGAHRAVGVQDGEWKLVRETGSEVRTELFNLAEDPGEAHDLYDDRPVRARYLLGLLQARAGAVTQSTRAAKVKPDASLRRRLDALGYVE